MAPAAEELAEPFNAVQMKETTIPVYANYTAKPYTGNYQELMINQITNPILWQKTIENMMAEGVDIFVEVGPGTRLGKMLSRISKDITLLNVENEETLNNAVEVIGGLTK